jgi:hypothetical protein
MALDIFEAYATDEEAEENGVWVPLGEDTKLKIARDGNDECERLVERLMMENADKLAAGGDVAKQAQREIEIEVTAATILKDWEKLTYKGEVIEYNEANARMVLQHKDFRRRVLFHARQRDAYLQKYEAEVAKN